MNTVNSSTENNSNASSAADFEKRRDHLAAMSENELKSRFWELAGKMVDPLVELGRTHTSPSIERSVLMRMGFASVEARAVVDRVSEAGLLGKGVGHVVWKVSQADGITVREAGRAIVEGRDISCLFKGSTDSGFPDPAGLKVGAR